MRKEKLLYLAAICFVVIGAGVLRLTGINFGLPRHLHPDEWSQVETAAKLSLADLNPHWFRYPSFMIYLLFLIYKAINFISSSFGIIINQGGYYLIGRIVSCLFGMGTIYFVYKLSKLIDGELSAFISVFFISFFSLHIINCHYATTDITLTFWITVVIYFIIAYFQTKRDYLYVAVLIGVAASTKYPGILATIPLLLTFAFNEETHNRQGTSAQKKALKFILLTVGLITLILFFIFPVEIFMRYATTLTTDGILEKEYILFILKIPLFFGFISIFSFLVFLMILKENKFAKLLINFLTDKKVILSILTSTAIFFLISPFIVFDFKIFLKDFFYEFRHMQIGSAATVSLDSPLYIKALQYNKTQPWLGFSYAKLLAKNNGLFFIFLNIVGITYLFLKNSKKTMVFICLPLVYFLIIANWRNYADRYFLPLVPFLCILAGSGASGLLFLLHSQRRKKNIYSICTSAVLLLFAVTFFAQVRNAIQTINAFLAKYHEINQPCL
jgi:4-amino-4-deoxy-L-arabinose transferase-like glycosyltransferase